MTIHPASRTRWRRAAAALLFGLLTPQAWAQVTLQVSTPSVVVAGTSFPVLVLVEGLGAAGDTLALGAYDFDVVLNDTLVSFVSIAFGDAAGQSGLDAGVGGSFQSFDASQAGRVTVREISLESEPDLLAAQPAGFALFAAQFNALAPGVWHVNLDSITLSDQSGNALTAMVVNGLVTIVPVPEPAPLGMLLAGLAAVGWCARRRAPVVKGEFERQRG